LSNHTKKQKDFCLWQVKSLKLRALKSLLVYSLSLLHSGLLQVCKIRVNNFNNGIKKLISNNSNDTSMRVEKVSDYFVEGEEVKVKVLEVDRQGKIRLTMKGLDG